MISQDSSTTPVVASGPGPGPAPGPDPWRFHPAEVLVAIGLGAVLGRKLPEKVIKYGAAAAFAVFGALLVAEGAGWL